MQALTAWLLAGFIALSVGTARAAELEGVKMPDTTIVDGKPLVLNGLGVRTRYGLAKVYVAGLYLPKPSNDGGAVLAQDGPKRMAFQLKRDVAAQTFAKSLNEGIQERATPEQLAALKDRLARFNDYIVSINQVKDGDVVFLDLVPGRGTQIVHNGQPIGEPVPGADFASALLALFVGPRPVQDSLKAGLLGAK
ncbi:MAG TPA: chalcone isomerase family protein [Burkholderiaceae bacterium]|nr:chalcone isomerase family protein [Burkholderiaceae bacterium]